MHPLERHFRLSTSVSLEDLHAGTPIACIDGRRTEATIGVPGGSSGLFLVLVHVLEQIRGIRSEGPSLEALLGEVARRIGSVYLHSDTHTLEALPRRLLDADDESEQRVDVLTSLLHPLPGRHEALLGLLSRPEFVGCGHLRAMSEDPDAYGIRPDLMSDYFRAFFRLLWRRHPRLQFEVLDGPHRETALVHMHVDPEAPDRLPSAVPSVENKQCFFHHPDAAVSVLRDLARHLIHSRRLAGMDENFLAGRLEATYAAWLSVTTQRIAVHVPHWSAFPEGGQFRLTPIPPSPPEREAATTTLMPDRPSVPATPPAQAIPHRPT